MNFVGLIYSFFLFIAFTAAETTSSSSSSATTTTTTSSQSKTSVWVTGTDANGITRTTQSVYYQSFKSAYTEAIETPSSGSAGLGSLSGSVGHLRTYDMTTISSGGAAAAVDDVAVGRTFMTFNSLFALLCLIL
ncbi:hypothetical protein KGF57_005084 [Candida theae]|uniref:Protein KRE1 n=1 Tax=Candida theae TaxID=1198502 RepID=A0AAD5BAF8_9ASCO|nr:uncharacterized protein KGF57_005084 [Candida theae]KAI5948891.1 hypothetical protein KGF57_005084 [Candida theae]